MCKVFLQRAPPAKAFGRGVESIQGVRAGCRRVMKNKLSEFIASSRNPEFYCGSSALMLWQLIAIVRCTREKSEIPWPTRSSTANPTFAAAPGSGVPLTGAKPKRDPALPKRPMTSYMLLGRILNPKPPSPPDPLFASGQV